MEVQVIVRSAVAVVKISPKKGTQYAQQTMGILFPGEEFPISEQVFVPVRNGEAVPFEVGTYVAHASVQKHQEGFLVKVDDRTFRRVDVVSGVAQAGQATQAKKAA